MDNVELQATCAALGYQEGETYQKEPDCLETVKDLIRFLKREDEHCTIRRQLGEAQILQRDLIPILKQYKDDRILLETVLRLMVNLTQPGKLCFQNHVPEDKTTRNYYLEVESHLQAYKEAFVDEALFAVLTKRLGDLLQLDWENRQEEDRLLIERILIIVRNMLHVPPNAAKEQRTDDDASVHDQVLWALHVSGMEDLLLYLASCEDERQFSFHVLEIISLMFREQTPDQLASAGGTRSLTEKEQDERELAMIREQEKAQKRAAVLKYSSRHSRFGGTFTVANMKSISERDMIYHRSLEKVKDISFDHNKTRKKRPKNRRPITEQDVTRRSTLSIRVFLKEFCVQFLENCYNALMRAIKDTLMRSKAQENDETYYLWAMRFFMEFNRKYQFRVELVSETLSVPTFHYIQTHLQNFHEMIMSQKKEGIIWSRRMHLALKSYRELLESLGAMDKSPDLSLRDSAKVIKSNVFYMLEYRDVFVILLRKFDETRQSRSFLKDLVETTHLFVKMLETFCKSNTHIVVQKKKKKKPKKKRQVAAAVVGPSEPTEQELEDLWDEVSSDLSAIFQGRADLPQDVAPFDAASEVDVDEQRASTMYRIQESLRQRRPGEGVALFRAAREVWPEREEFGRPDIAPEEEFMAMREVFFAPLPRPGGQEVDPQQEVEAVPEEDPYEDEMEEAEESSYRTEEQEFNFNDFITRFAQPQIMRTYAILLADFKKSSQHTNHCIMKMMHRVGFDLNYIGMLFHVRIFRIFQKIMTDPACRVKHFDELWQFAKHVIRKFFEVVQTNNKIFVELFFWKSSKESIEIVDGYGSMKDHSKKVKQIWTEEQDMELTQLYDQFKDDVENGKDVVDQVMYHMIDQRKTRRQVLRQLVHLNLIGSAKDIKKKKSGGPPRSTWREEQELELRQLFEQHKESEDILGNIVPNMTHPRTKVRVIEKLLELGLVTDRKQLYKKRGKGQGRSRQSKHGDLEEGSDLENDQHREISAEFVDRSDSEDSLPPEPEDDLGSGSDGEETPSSGEEESTEPEYVKQIKKTVKKVVKKGLSSPLEWMRKSLGRTADDREEDGDEEPIPVVPLQEEHEDAMENSAFRAMLRSVGLKPPANEQERYWRIPGYLSPDEIRSRVEAMAPPSVSAENLSRKKASDRFASLQALVKQKKTGEKRENRRKRRESSQSGPSTSTMPEDSDQPGNQSDDAPEPDEEPSNKSNPDTSHLELVLSDSDQSDAALNDTPGSPPQSATRGSKKRSRLLRSFDSESEDGNSESPLKDNDSGSSNEKPSKRARILEDSDSEHEDSDKENAPTEAATEHQELQTFPATMLSQPVTDSDSDIDDHIPLRRAVKRAAVVSDSDEE